jgi:hypothetical protein
VLEGELRAAVERGEIADPDVELTAFEIDAVLSAANTAMRLGEPDVPDRVRWALARLIGAPLAPEKGGH